MSDQPIIEISPEEQITVDIFQPGDAAHVGELFRSVYGENYPVRLVYEPDALVEAFNNNENIPIVARSSKGRLAGYVSLFRSAPNKAIYEVGQGLIHGEYRQYGLSHVMERYLSEVTAPSYNVDAYFAEVVCNHVYAQKTMARGGAIETALEVDLMPADAFAREGTATGRVASLHMTRIYRPAEHTVYAPGEYEEAMRFIYEGFNSGAIVAKAGGAIPGGLTTSIESRVFESASVGRFVVRDAGPDFRDVFERYEVEALDKGTIVLQVWLNLSWPWIGGLTGHLRSRGYFFGGILPLWFGTDGLLMQKITGKPNWEGIHLYSEKAQRVRDIIREDHGRSQSR